MTFTKKYNALCASVTRHLTFFANPDDTTFTTVERSGEKLEWTPNERMGRLVHVICIALALMDRPSILVKRAEAEFIKVHKRCDPITFAVHRAE